MQKKRLRFKALHDNNQNFAFTTDVNNLVKVAIHRCYFTVVYLSNCQNIASVVVPSNFFPQQLFLLGILAFLFFSHLNFMFLLSLHSCSFPLCYLITLYVNLLLSSNAKLQAQFLFMFGIFWICSLFILVNFT